MALVTIEIDDSRLVGDEVDAKGVFEAIIVSGA